MKILNLIHLLNLIFYFLFIDGDKDKEDIRRGIIGADDAGGRQKLLRTIRSGEYKYQYQIYNIITLLCNAELNLSNIRRTLF